MHIQPDEIQTERPGEPQVKRDTIEARRAKHRQIVNKTMEWMRSTGNLDWISMVMVARILDINTVEMGHAVSSHPRMIQARYGSGVSSAGSRTTMTMMIRLHPQLGGYDPSTDHAVMIRAEKASRELVSMGYRVRNGRICIG